MTTAEWTADAINILLIVLIVCVFVAGIIAVKGFIEERMLRKRSIRFALVFGFLFMVYLVVHVLADLNLLADWDALSGLREILPSGWAQIFLVLGLVGVTGFYALMAFRQAKASVKMAEEMKEQRQGEARPYILLRLNGEAIQWVDIEPNERRPTKFEVTIRNVGNGPAINLWAARWSHEKSFFGDSKGYLAPNENWTTGISNISTMIVRLRAEKDIWLPELREVIENKYPGIVAVKYNDIHHRVWVSYLCLEWHHSVDGYVMEGEQNIVEVMKP